MKNRVWFTAGAVALVAMLAGACEGGGASEEDGEVTIGVVLPPLNEFTFYRSVKEGIDEELENHPNVNVEYSNLSAFTPQRYLDAIDTVASQGVDALAFDAYDPELFEPVIRRLSASGISVVTFGNPPIGDETSRINTDTEGAIRAGIESMMEEMGGTGEVGLITFPGNGVVTERIELAKEFIPEFGGEIVGEAPATTECTLVSTANATQDLLQAYPDVAGLFLPCGTGPTLGATRAAAQAGRDDLVIYTYDCLEEEIEALKDGSLAGAIAQRPKEIGATTVRVMIDIARGESVKEQYDVGFQIVTEDNVDTYEIG